MRFFQVMLIILGPLLCAGPGGAAQLLVAPVGEAEADYFGRSVASAGDVNGDGYADVLVGAHKNNAGGVDAGRAYLFFGGPAPDATPDLTLTGGATGEEFGFAVAGAGDVNGDGYDDVVVGTVFGGTAYVLFGGGAPDATPDLTLTGSPSDKFGYAVAGGGDVNGDGYDDVIVGAFLDDAGGQDAGRADIFYGGPAPDTTPDLVLTGPLPGGYFGAAVAAAGDMNGDGYGDVIVGAHQEAEGRAYVFFGGAAPDTAIDLTLVGEVLNDAFGRADASAGDVNGDAYADLLVGAEQNDAGGPGSDNRGRAYVFFGGDAPNATADLVLTGAAAGDYFGVAVASAGDVNADTYADLIVGAILADGPHSDSGRAYVFLGGPLLDTQADAVLDGAATNDYFGHAASSAGDMNQDGFADVVVGAYLAGADDEGAAYVYSITSAPAPVITSITPAVVTAADTGVDLVISGTGFRLPATIHPQSRFTTNYSSLWPSDQLHVNLNIAAPQLGDNLEIQVQLQVENPDGQLSNPQTTTIRRFPDFIPHPRDYAPTLRFVGLGDVPLQPEKAEPWFPTSPLFQGQDGSTFYTNATSRNDAYKALPRSTRMNSAVVYYHVVGDDEPPVPFANIQCRVYEYWMYYTFDDFALCGTTAMNKHQHDWEKFFVFVSAASGDVVGMAGGAHHDFDIANVHELQTPRPSPYHPVSIVELGSHAQCPDFNRNGVFERATDLRYEGWNDEAWGIRDDIHTHTDSLSGWSGYRLASLEGIREILEGSFTAADLDYWPGSREEACCHRFDGVFRGEVRVDRTFVNSTPEPAAEDGLLVQRVGARFCEPGQGNCWHLELPWRVGHVPVPHPWVQEHYADPRGLLPNGGDRWTRGWAYGLVPIEDCQNVAFLFPTGGGAGKVQVGPAATSRLGFAAIGPGGRMGFVNLVDGRYTLLVHAPGMAPYQQQVHVAPGDTLLGASGRIELVAQDSAFTLNVLVRGAAGNPIPDAQVRVFVEPNTLFLPTLTNLEGAASASLRADRSHKVVISVASYADSIDDVSGTVGDNVLVTFDTPVQVSDTRDADSASLGVRILQRSSPNPFSPGTVVEIRLPHGTDVAAAIYDARGRRIQELVRGRLSAGLHRIPWDGTDSAGRQVPSGVYACRLSAMGRTESWKLVKLR